MPTPPDTSAAILDQVITDLQTIRDLPTKARILALVPLLDRSSERNVESQLANARSHAARDAAAQEFGGNMTALAADIGVTAQRISTLVAGISSRRRSARTRAAKAGAVGG